MYNYSDSILRKAAKNKASKILGQPILIENLAKLPVFKITNDKDINILIHNYMYYILDYSRVHNNYNEYGVLLNMYTEDVEYFTGKFDNKRNICTINVWSESKYKLMLQRSDDNSLIFIHNHPNNSKLSLGDIMNFYLSPEIAVVIAIGNDCKTLHKIVKLNNNRKYINDFKLLQYKYGCTKELIKYIENNRHLLEIDYT